MSACGYPEGCPMSVVAMFLLDQAMHAMVTRQAAPCRAISYVDNWEIVSSVHDQVPVAKNALTDFVERVGLSLDQAKTYCWALTAKGRKYLKLHMGAVQYDAKDLVGHLVYCKRGTIHTISGRIKTNQDLWIWLARSPAPDSQKLHVLASVAWPRCLHGISGVKLGIAHVKRLRSAAMSALGWDKRGASSAIQFGLGLNPKADPGFYILWDTVADFRMHARPEYAFHVMDKLGSVLPPQIPQGPCAAVINQLHGIAWQWIGDGFVIDHEGLRWSIVDTPTQWLFLRLLHGWCVVTGGCLQARNGFAGLSDVDRTTSVAKLATLSVEHLGWNEWNVLLQRRPCPCRARR